MINSKEALFGFGSLFTWFPGMIELCLYLSSVVGDLQGILIHQMSVNHFTVLLLSYHCLQTMFLIIVTTNNNFLNKFLLGIFFIRVCVGSCCKVLSIRVLGESLYDTGINIKGSMF